jgi:hypothetical protein
MELNKEKKMESEQAVLPNPCLEEEEEEEEEEEGGGGGGEEEEETHLSLSSPDSTCE